MSLTQAASHAVPRLARAGSVRRAGATGVLLLVLARLAAGAEAPAGAASEDDDLARIPPAAGETSEAGGRATSPAAASAAGAAQRLRLEDAYAAWSNRTRVPVPLPGPVPAHQDRLSLDADLNRSVADGVRVAFSDRLSRYAGDDNPAASSAQWLNDLREAWVSWQVAPGRFLQAGRINLRNGVAEGWNPTDFFKPRSTVSQASIDPSSARDNRLGTAMLEGQVLWPAGTLTLALAPAISHAAPLLTSTRGNGFDAGWDRTNGEDRGLLSFSPGDSEYNPQLLAFRDAAGSHWGFNASHVVSASTVAWLEWAGTRAQLLSARAIGFAQATGTLPAGVPLVPQSDPGSAFRQDLATGLAWTSSTNVTVAVEYHHHDGGFAEGDFARWLAFGAQGARQADLAWLVRSYAADQQEPLMRSEWFLRLDWQDVIPSTLNLGALAFLQPHQGASLVQLSAQWFASRRWTLSAYAQFADGPPASVWGSLPARASGALQAALYF